MHDLCMRTHTVVASIAVTVYATLILTEEEMEKRLLAQRDETSFRAVGFSYGHEATPPKESFLLMSHPQRPEHPPTSSVDIGGDEETFTPPAGLVVPEELKVVRDGEENDVIDPF